MPVFPILRSKVHILHRFMKILRRRASVTFRSPGETLSKWSSMFSYICRSILGKYSGILGKYSCTLGKCGGILGKYGGIFGNYGGTMGKYSGIFGKYSGILGK